MTVIKVTYNQIAPVIKITYDINEVFVGGESAAPIYVSVNYASGVASGNVSSVALSMPTGFTVSGSPITTAGTFIVNIADGYVLPTQAMLDAKVPYTGATGSVNLGEYGLSTGRVAFDQTPTLAGGVGIMRWNDQDGTVDLGLKGGNVTLQLGQEQVARVVNKTGANLLESEFKAVRVSGAQGQRLGVSLAQANNDNNSADTIGLVTENIAVNQEGFITTFGRVSEINTTGSVYGETWADGDVLYLSGTTPGAITNVKPIAPAHIVVLGYVEYAHQNHGKIFVKVMNGWELDELHNVLITSPSNGQVLKYDSASQLWKNAADTVGTGTVTSVAAIAGTGISITGSPITTSGTLNITNTAPDQIVSLTGTGTTTITGTYPNFTINSDDQYDGTVTSIATSSPLTGGTITTSGTIGITQSSNSTDGYLSSTDWNTFNSKQTALNGTGFVKISGTTISYDNSTYYLASNPSAYIALTNLSAGTGMSYDNTTGVITNALPDQVVSLTGAGTTNISGSYPNFTITSADQYLGTVTSVAASVPTGFTIGGSPVTSSGTLAIGFASGYSLPTDAKQTDWDTAYTNRITSLTTNNNSGAATLSSNTLNIPNYTLSGLGGEPAITAGTSLQYWRGDKSWQTLDTLAVAENTNLYFTADRVRNTLLTGLNLTGGGTIAATDSVLQAFGKVQNQISALVGGVMYAGTWNASTNSPTLTSSVGTKGNYYIVTVAGSTNLNGITDWKIGDWAIFNGSSWDKVDNTDAVSSVNGYTGAVSLVTDDIPEAGSPTNLYFTNARARSAISLTTTGSSGAATYSSSTGVLNVPNYTLSGLGGVPSSRQLTINGTAYDLSADRTWSVGTVTSVAALTIDTTGTDITSTVANGTTTPVITLNIPTASATNRGALSSTDWSTFNNKQNALSFGNLTETTSSILTISGGTGAVIGSGTTIQVKQASGSQSGFLSSTDWTTFNSKQDALTNPITGTGVRTVNYLPRFVTGTTIQNSAIRDNGTVIYFERAVEGSLGTFTNTVTVYGLLMNAISPRLAFNNSTGGGLGYIEHNASNLIYNATVGTHVFNQNLGLGVTPTAWTNGWNVLQLGTYSSLFSDNSGRANIAYNVYNSGGNDKFLSNIGGASKYVQSGGYHSWLHATGGTATNNITWTLGMELTTGGRLILGAVDDGSTRLQVSGAATFSSSVTAGARSFIKGAAGYLFDIEENSANKTRLQLYVDTSEVALISGYDTTAKPITFYTGGAKRATLDINGNLGLGVTPSAWNLKGFDISGGALFGDANNVGLAVNAYYNSGWLYKSSATAANYIIVGNEHRWNTAPSGTAGNAITFTQAMTLDASGRLGIGTTSPTSKLEIKGNIAIQRIDLTTDTGLIFGNEVGTSRAYLNFSAIDERLYYKFGTLELFTIASTGAATFSSSVTANGSTTAWGVTAQFGNTYGNRDVRIGTDVTNGENYMQSYVTSTNATRQLSINPYGGNVGIGTTSPSEKLEVNGAIKTAAPTGGTAKPWKLGSYVAGTTCGTLNLGYIELDVDGTLYKLALAETNC